MLGKMMGGGMAQPMPFQQADFNQGAMPGAGQISPLSSFNQYSQGMNLPAPQDTFWGNGGIGQARNAINNPFQQLQTNAEQNIPGMQKPQLPNNAAPQMPGILGKLPGHQATEQQDSVFSKAGLNVSGQTPSPAFESSDSFNIMPAHQMPRQDYQRAANTYQREFSPVAANEALEPFNPQKIGFQQGTDLPKVPGINPNAITYGSNAYAQYKDKIGNPNVATIVDFSQPSNKPRMAVIDTRSGKVLMQTYVAQGVGSGRGPMAQGFSNTPNSRQSSLGVFTTGDVYNGKHGPSMRIQGLQKGINDNAMTRAVVVHGANYATPEFIKSQGRAGNSWGCFAIPPKDMAKYMELTKGGSMIFAYADPKQGANLNFAQRPQTSALSFANSLRSLGTGATEQRDLGLHTGMNLPTLGGLLFGNKQGLGGFLSPPGVTNESREPFSLITPEQQQMIGQTGDKALGWLSAKFESNGNPGSVAKDNKGYAYGTYQLNSATGGLNNFLKTSGYGDQFKGLTPGSQAFNNKWKELGQSPQFAQAQQQYIKKEYFNPVRGTADKLGLPNTSKVNEALLSMGVNHGTGGAAKILKRAGISGDLSESDVLKKIYGARVDFVKGAKIAGGVKVKNALIHSYNQQLASLLGS